jgi:hypothetical protein
VQQGNICSDLREIKKDTYFISQDKLTSLVCFYYETMGILGLWSLAKWLVKHKMQKIKKSLLYITVLNAPLFLHLSYVTYFNEFKCSNFKHYKIHN